MTEIVNGTPSSQLGIGKIAALPSFENNCYFRGGYSLESVLEAATSPIPGSLYAMWDSENSKKLLNIVEKYMQFDRFKIASLDNSVGLVGLSRFLQFCSVFFLRTLSVWSCSFRKLHSHHHEIFFRQEQASLPLLRPQKNSTSQQKTRQPFGKCGCFEKPFVLLRIKVYLCRNFFEI